jgi:hypothetical protein
MSTLGIALFIYSISMFSIETKRFSSRADSASAPVQVQVSVFRRVFMALWAMRFKFVIFACSTTSTILFMGHYFKMSWVAAQSYFAPMIDFHAFWNRTYQQFINKPVGRDEFTRNRNMSVTTIAASFPCTHPNPAIARGRNILFDIFRQIRDLHIINPNFWRVVV